MPEIPSCILVDLTATQLHEIAVDTNASSLMLRMSTTGAEGLCPTCQQPATRIHSHYQRTLADLPWAQCPVRIRLSVRRFFCDSPTCTQRIFTERLPAVAEPWARRTKRLAAVQQQLGCVVGGAAGAALSSTLACPAGVDLLLTLVRQYQPSQHPTPRVLGVDDWAIRKGQRYGTILIDHEREEIVDLLPDRTPERLAQWLREHPGVEIVTRDRAEAYAQGICQGAPDALQVADRWHLIKNVTDAVAQVLQDQRQAIHQQLSLAAQMTAPIVRQVPNAAEPSPPSVEIARPATLTAVVAATPADQRRQEAAQEAHVLHERGWSQKEIAQHLNCHPRTVRRYLRRTLPLSPRGGVRGSKLDRYKPYLLKRWNEGCHNATQLLREVVAQGFDGRSTLIRTYVASLRVQSGIPARVRTASGQSLPTTATERVPSSRELAWMSSQPLHSLDEAQRTMLSKLGELNTPVKTALELGQAFAAMVRDRQVEQIDGWLERAANSGIAALRSVAKGLRDDLAAVRAALTLPWSNGRTEGSVNRLKCVKRQMYGRGKLDLLRLRLLAT